MTKTLLYLHVRDPGFSFGNIAADRVLRSAQFALQDSGREDVVIESVVNQPNDTDIMAATLMSALNNLTTDPLAILAPALQQYIEATIGVARAFQVPFLTWNEVPRCTERSIYSGSSVHFGASAHSERFAIIDILKHFNWDRAGVLFPQTWAGDFASELYLLGVDRDVHFDRYQYPTSGWEIDTEEDVIRESVLDMIDRDQHTIIIVYTSAWDGNEILSVLEQELGKMGGDSNRRFFVLLTTSFGPSTSGWQATDGMMRGMWMVRPAVPADTPEDAQWASNYAPWAERQAQVDTLAYDVAPVSSIEPQAYDAVKSCLEWDDCQWTADVEPSLGMAGVLDFDDYGSRKGVFDIVNYYSAKNYTVMGRAQNYELRLDADISEVFWPHEEFQAFSGAPPGMIVDNIPTAVATGVSALAAAVGAIATVLAVLTVYLRFQGKNRLFVQASGTLLSVSLMGVAVSTITSALDPWRHDRPLFVCGYAHAIFDAVSFWLVFWPITLKCLRVLHIYRNRHLESKRLPDMHILPTVLIPIAAELIVFAARMAVDSPERELVALRDAPGHAVWMCTTDTPVWSVIIVAAMRCIGFLVLLFSAVNVTRARFLSALRDFQEGREIMFVSALGGLAILCIVLLTPSRTASLVLAVCTRPFLLSISGIAFMVVLMLPKYHMFFTGRSLFEPTSTDVTGRSTGETGKCEMTQRTNPYSNGLPSTGASEEEAEAHPTIGRSSLSSSSSNSSAGSSSDASSPSSISV